MNDKKHTDKLSEFHEESTKNNVSISLKNVWKSYNDIAVLKGLSLEVPSKATTVILGRSGAGKSVTLKLILGFEEADSGDIIIDGKNVGRMKPKERTRYSSKRVGMLFQSSALFDSMTIEENIAFSIENTHFKEIHSHHQIREIVAESLERVGLDGFQKKYPSELSGGQKRRAALARLIVYKPKILLFDEPTTGLDPVTSMQINKLISDTQKTLEATCIVITHDLVSALSIGDYFALHHDGIIAAFGEKERFFKNDDQLLHEFVKSAMAPKEDRDLLAKIS